MSSMYKMDMEIRSNQDWVDSVALWLPDTAGAPTTDPFPIDETWTIIQHLRKPNEMLIPILVNSSDNGRLEIVTNTGGTETRIQWNVTRDVIQHLPAGVYFHDVKLIDPDGGEIILFAGTVTQTLGTTRP